MMHYPRRIARLGINTIEAQVPAGKAVHIILDNYAVHKHPNVRGWLDRHERFTDSGVVISRC
jgi:hypothetical protein